MIKRFRFKTSALFVVGIADPTTEVVDGSETSFVMQAQNVHESITADDNNSNDVSFLIIIRFHIYKTKSF